jgi:hypothetical protein
LRTKDFCSQLHLTPRQKIKTLSVAKIHYCI